MQLLNREAKKSGELSHFVAAPEKLLAIAEPGMDNELLYQHLRELLNRFGCSVELVVFGNNEAIKSIDDAEVSAEEWRAKMQDSARPYITRSQNFSAQVVNCEDIASWVIEHCTQGNIDLVLKMGHRTETLFYHPTDWQLVRGLPCALLLLSQRKWRKRPEVLSALDMVSDNVQQENINRDVLAWTQLLAGSAG